jgi:hypothetical protein
VVLHNGVMSGMGGMGDAAQWHPSAVGLHGRSVPLLAHVAEQSTSDDEERMLVSRKCD